MNELITIPKETALTVFTEEKGLDPILKKISDEVNLFVADLSTAGSRAKIASIAAKIRSSKSYLDKEGKKLTDKLKEQPKLVDAERKRMRDQLDALALKVRKPLTDWEETEALRLDSIKSRILNISSIPEIELGSDALKSHLKRIELTEIDDSFAEFKGDAAIEKDSAIIETKKLLEIVLSREMEKAELEKLRKEADEREQKERDAKLVKEAEDRARQKAEDEAQARINAAEAATDKLKLAALKAKNKAKEAKEEEVRRAAQIEKDKKEAELLAQKRVEDAKKEEVDRIARERKEEDEERLRIADNEEHRAKVNAEILFDMRGIATFDGISDEAINHLLEELRKGSVRHVTINY